MNASGPSEKEQTTRMQSSSDNHNTNHPPIQNNSNDAGIPLAYRTKWDSVKKRRFRKIKSNFEGERVDVLSSIPPTLTDLFGQVGFVKWGKTTLPVLVRNPCDVALGQARHLWFEMYSDLRDQDKLQNVSLLIYWYGASKDLGNAYSLIPVKNFIPYAMGVKKSLHIMAPKIQARLDKGTASRVERQRAEGLEELKLDLAKVPGDRCGYLNEDMDEFYAELAELSDDDDVIFEDEPDSIPTSRQRERRPKKKRKTKTAPASVQDIEPIVSVASASQSPSDSGEERERQEGQRLDNDTIAMAPPTVVSSSAPSIPQNQNEDLNHSRQTLNMTERMLKSIQVIWNSMDATELQQAMKELDKVLFLAGGDSERKRRERTFVHAISCGIFPATLSLLRQHSEEQDIVLFGLRVLCKLTYKSVNIEMLRVLVDTRAVETVLELQTKKIDNGAVQLFSIGFISNMIVIFKGPVVETVGGFEGSIKFIVDVMERHQDNGTIQKYGCKLIWQLIHEDEGGKSDMKNRLISNSALSTVGRALETHLDHVKVQEWGKKVMDALLLA